MSDVVGDLLAGLPERQVDGPELLGFGDVDGPFDHLPDDLLDLGSELLQEGFDLLLAGGPGAAVSGMCVSRMESTGEFAPTPSR
ncbi:MAG TPA: hypothetical protein VH092_26440 [Urbifossiella sp.]|nr:hypothetical protein [Urbifossiella sp.]